MSGKGKTLAHASRVTNVTSTLVVHPSPEGSGATPDSLQTNSFATASCSSIFDEDNAKIDPKEDLEVVPNYLAFGIDIWENWLQKDQMALICYAYDIPTNITTRTCFLGELFSTPPEGFMALSTSFFRCGLRLPLSSKLHALLLSCKVDPGQIALNG